MPPAVFPVDTEGPEDSTASQILGLMSAPTEEAGEDPRKRPLLHSQSGHASFPSARTPSSVPP